MKNYNLLNKISKEERIVYVKYSSMTFAEFFNGSVFEIKREYSYES